MIVEVSKKRINTIKNHETLRKLKKCSRAFGGYPMSQNLGLGTLFNDTFKSKIYIITKSQKIWSESQICRMANFYHKLEN